MTIKTRAMSLALAFPLVPAFAPAQGGNYAKTGQQAMSCAAGTRTFLSASVRWGAATAHVFVIA